MSRPSTQDVKGGRLLRKPSCGHEFYVEWGISAKEFEQRKCTDSFWENSLLSHNPECMCKYCSELIRKIADVLKEKKK